MVLSANVFSHSSLWLFGSIFRPSKFRLWRHLWEIPISSHMQVGRNTMNRRTNSGGVLGVYTPALFSKEMKLPCYSALSTLKWRFMKKAWFQKFTRGFTPVPQLLFSIVIRNSSKNHRPSEQRYQYTSHSISSTCESAKQCSKAIPFSKSFSVPFCVDSAPLLLLRLSALP